MSPRALIEVGGIRYHRFQGKRYRRTEIKRESGSVVWWSVQVWYGSGWRDVDDRTEMKLEQDFALEMAERDEASADTDAVILG